MELRTYYDFALDDYRFLCELKKSGITANSIGAIAQNTCERFLKYLINEFIPVSEDNRQVITEILTTHSLNRLVFFPLMLIAQIAILVLLYIFTFGWK